MLKVVTKTIEVDVDESELIAPGDAARITGRSVQSIVTMMNLGKLPTYLLPNDERQRPQKFTGRAEVVKLAKRKKAK